MAKVAHPIALDQDLSRTSDALQPPHTRQHGAVFFRLRGQVIAAIAILGVLFLISATPGRVHEAVVAPVSASTMTTATPVAKVQKQPGNRPTGYFPDQFKVEQWDESPLPPQF
jgi:hypothetical protein